MLYTLGGEETLVAFNNGTQLINIMAASAIAISSDSPDESVGSSPSRDILFGVIPTVIPSTYVVNPETSTIAPVISSALMCFDSDSPDEMSLPEHISPLPAISPFLCTDSSETPDSSEAPDSFDGPPSQIRRWPAILIRLGEAIPFGRPYRTHLNGPYKFLTARKRVGPLPTHRLACRHTSPHYSDHRLSSSSLSLDYSPVHSSGLDAPDQTHSGSSTRDVSPRLGYPPRREPQRSEAFCHWCAAPLSTLYPPNTSESSLGDSSERPLYSSSHFAEPSRKRCRSPVDSVPSSIPVMGSLAPTRADLLPPRKRFRDSYSSEASIEEDAEIDPIETEVDIELGISDGDDVRDHVKIDPRDVWGDTEEYEADISAGDTVEVGIDPMSAPIVEEEIVEPAGDDSSYLSGTKDDIVRSFEDMPIDLNDVVRNFYHHMSKVKRIDSLRFRESQVRAAKLDIERDHVNSLCLHMSLSREEFRQNNDYHSLRNENPYENVRGDRPVARECTYQDFMKCQPLNLKGTEGVVGLIRWFEKMETVFHISNCPEKSQVKYATCTLLDSALTWWNSHKRTIGTEAAFAMSWGELMKLMTKVYCPRNEIQKMETELWNLTVKNNDLTAYTQRFQELTMMCTKMVPEEEDRVEKFIGGLPNNIQGNVIAAEPTRLQDAIQIVNNLMDKKLKGYANTGGQNVARAYVVGNNKKKEYEGQMVNQRDVTCFECGAPGHFRKDCPKVKNQNRGNKTRVPDARGKAYVLGGGVDRSFVSNTFSGLLDITPSALDVSYAVELADRRTSETNTLGSFDVIIGMDWLAKNHAVIVCDEKIVCIPYGNEILIVQGDKSDKEKKSTLSIILCVKAQKYIEKGCQLFLAQVMVKETEDKSKEKRIWGEKHCLLLNWTQVLNIYVMSIVRYGGLWFGTPVKGRNTMWHDMICLVDY
ncbi:putative reverse transcriptase domain-containing protein [Tanacetum coccineum]